MNNMNVLEKIDMLLVEATNNNKSKFPIHPSRETREQGEQAAAEKILQIFQRLQMGGGGSNGPIDNIPDIPDNIIDPLINQPLKSKKDMSFEMNKLVGWDKDDHEKIEKEVEVNDQDDDPNDEFDDFDYRDNEFGDDDDDMDNNQNDDNRSENDKLKDNIKDALDSLDRDGNDDGDEFGDDSKKSLRRQQIERMKEMLDNENLEDFNDASDELKNTIDTPDDNIQPGGKMNTPDDYSVKKDLEKAGLNKKDIDKTIIEKNKKISDDYTEEEIDEIEQQVIDGLEKRCKNGESALANSIISASEKRKLNSDEWKKLLSMFLKKESINSGNYSKSNNEIKFGNKNHLWRGAVLPTISAPSNKGEVQKIYCFVDFSGSVNQNLVYHFLGEVINLSVTLKYTDVDVYGFANLLSLPRNINYKKMMENSNSVQEGIRRALDETWTYINQQNVGSVEEFQNVAMEINKIKRKDSNSVILVFGDGEWHSIKNLRDYISRSSFLKDVCILIYFTGKPDPLVIKTVDLIKRYVGVENVITSKTKDIVPN
jgi:hypothetical protein